MKKAWYALLVLAMLGGAYFLGSRSTQGTSTMKSPGTRTVQYYVDPMHPAYKSDKPGIAPDCGMELVPVYDDGSMGGSPGQTAPPLGAVNVSTEKQQLIGIKTASVEKAPGQHVLRAFGRVVPDEGRVYRVTAATDAWVRMLMPPTTGSPVKKDEMLAGVYAPEMFSAMRAFTYGVQARDRAPANEAPGQADVVSANIANYRNGLRNLGMTETQMDEIMRTRKPADLIEIRSPSDGFVLSRNISPGQRLEKGSELYRIADLAQVWIVVDTFEREAVAFKPGTQVRLLAPNLGKAFMGRVAAVPPRFDATSRTMQVRIEADNPELLLRPDMFVDVELPVRQPAGIAIPADAIVDSGAQKTVYVDRGEGAFEPRRVETGWRAGDRVEIRSGLKPGERIVVAGTFLLDSESRMRAAGSGQQAAGSERAQSKGEEAHNSGKADSENIRTATPVARAFAIAKDPICGMEVDITKATAAGLTLKYQGKPVYFCSEDCKLTFSKDPKRYTGANPQPADPPP